MSTPDVSLTPVIKFVVTTCACGGIYALTETYVAKKREESGFWNCPYCQVGWGFVESDLKKLERRLAEEKERHAGTRTEVEEKRRQRDAANRRIAAQKGALTRLKSRIASGTCPHCSRSFSNLGAHAAKRHGKKNRKDTRQ